MTSTAENLKVADQTYADAAYRKLKAALVSGVFRPGDALRERELVLRMGVSRTPIREALQRLALEGVLEIPPHRGARVRRLEIEEARELYELRRALEGQSAELAAERAHADALARLEAAAAASTGADGPTPQSLLVNHEFHMSVAALAANTRLAAAIEQTLDLISLWRMGALASGVSRRDVAAEHRAVFEAVAGRDGRRARRLMERHLAASWENSLAAARSTPNHTKGGPS